MKLIKGDRYEMDSLSKLMWGITSLHVKVKQQKSPIYDNDYEIGLTPQNANIKEKILP
jgi:hypothetical protein